MDQLYGRVTTIPQSLYVDWHRCFVFHRLALAAIHEGLGSLVWLSDHRIATVSNSSIDRSTVDLDRGEMSFSLFPYDPIIDQIATDPSSSVEKLGKIAATLGDVAFPNYLRRYIERVCPNGSDSLIIHPSSDISTYTDADGLDKKRVIRKRGFFGKTQLDQAKNPLAIHHLKVFHNEGKNARLFYKFVGSIQFIKNTSHDSRI